MSSIDVGSYKVYERSGSGPVVQDSPVSCKISYVAWDFSGSVVCIRFYPDEQRALLTLDKSDKSPARTLHIKGGNVTEQSIRQLVAAFEAIDPDEVYTTDGWYLEEEE